MPARVQRLAWRDIPLEEIGLPKAKLSLTLGLGSGLSVRGGRLFAATDRGPNIFVSEAVGRYGLDHLGNLRGVHGAKVLPRPDEGAEIAELLVEAGEVKLVSRTPLRTRPGRRLSGRSLPEDEAEPLFDLQGGLLAPDALGADTEAIAAMPGGGFFLAEEYGPSLLKVDAGGVVSERWVAAGMERALAHTDLVVRGVLPARARRRQANRGFEALCASGDGAWLYVGFQSALEGEDERSVPVWKLDARTGALAAEYFYPFDDPLTFRRDAGRRKLDTADLKICEFVWAGNERLIVLERIAYTSKIYAVSLAQPLAKQLLLSSDDFPEIGPDMEGLAMLSPRELLLVSDNDFGVEGAQTEFWRISFDEPIA